MPKPRYAVIKFTFVALAALASLGSAESYALRTVAPGDSLGLIAERYGVSVADLMAVNGLADNLIHPGQLLRVPLIDAIGGPANPEAKAPPGFRWHSLQAGETLSSVAQEYGVSLTAMVGANPDISSLDRLPQGFDLLVPPAQGLVVTLRHGESLLDLMASHDIPAGELARANGLRSPFDVVPGMLLFLPGAVPSEALARLQKVREEENRYVWPLQGRLTSYFGPRNLGMGTSSFHRGIDIAAPWGAPIGAARAGTVTYAGWSSQGYGNLVKIRHAGGAETWYGHFSSLTVSVGQYVNQGAIIGYVGSTGISTGPHLHFELYEANRALDPLGLLR